MAHDKEEMRGSERLSRATLSKSPDKGNAGSIIPDILLGVAILLLLSQGSFIVAPLYWLGIVGLV